MSDLRTDYKDDVFTGSRKYHTVNNPDGTVSFTDETEYEQNGDTYGAAQINEVNDIINNLDSSAYRKTDSVENTLADNDYLPFYDTSASASKKTPWSNIKSLLTQLLAIKVHNSNSAGTYGAGNASSFGHVKLSDNYTSSAGNASQSVGASSQSVYNTYNYANTKYTEVVNELTANNKRIYMDYKNGKYGINTSANRGADTFVPFNPYSETVLWQKSYSELVGRNFDQQIITISQSIQNFTFLKFDCYNTIEPEFTSLLVTFSALCTPAGLRQTIDLPYHVRLGCFGVSGLPRWWESEGPTYIRQFAAQSNTTIWIDDGRAVGEAEGLVNHVIVPYKITGIKIGQQ